MYKVIFHLNEKEKVETACRNIENLLDDIEGNGEEIEIELLVHAGAVKSFKKNNEKNHEEIKSILKRDVKIAICNNTLNGLKLNKEDLLDDLFVVTSGVGELTRKQNAGWAYIKP